jgi:hypothetical protein
MRVGTKASVRLVSVLLGYGANLYKGPKDRFQWKSTFEEQADIRGGMMLMFENIRNNGLTIDVSTAEVQSTLFTPLAHVSLIVL